MKILNILNSPWAIQPQKLIDLQAIYATHLRGEKIDIASVEARIGKTLANEQKGYTVQDGVAVLPVSGVLAKKMNMFTQISGGTSMEIAARDLKSAAVDTSVKSILLLIDSPGGTVDGTQAMAAAVRQAAAQKPVVALADGVMASAAYWIGSAAHEVIASSDTTQVGSIGVVAAHRDVSGSEAKEGIKTTEITAGKYKRIASSYAPLTDEGRAEIQGQVDALYSIFVDAVAENRGVDAEKVLSDMADGRVFLARDAMRAGLVDRIAGFDETLARMQSGEWPQKRQTALPSGITASAIEASATDDQGEKMDIKTLRENHPEIAQALVAEGEAQGKLAGAEAERQRIRDVEAQALAGHEALINTLKFDGKTTGAEAAIQVLNAERATRAKRADALAADAPAALPHAAAPEDKPAAADLPFDERIKAEWDKDANLRAEFSGNFETYKAFATAQAAGQVKILSK